jgi:uncharacterized OsmC-like protein
MPHEERIKTAFERKVKALSARPSIGRGTAVTTARLIDGLTCEIEEGDWKLVADMGEVSGGNNKGPNPGILGRAALGSCLAMGYALWAAERDIRLKSVEVEIQADYDASGHYGVNDDVTAGYTEVRYMVTIESDAPEADITKMVDEADAHTPLLVVFGKPQPLKRELRVVAPRS